MVCFLYTRVISMMTFEHHRTLTLRTVHLLTVLVEPFLFNVLQSPGPPLEFFETSARRQRSTSAS